MRQRLSRQLSRFGGAGQSGATTTELRGGWWWPNWSDGAAQRQLEQRLKIKLSQPQVHRVVYRLKQELAEQPALELLPVGAGEGDVAAVAVAAEPESDALPSQEFSNQLEQPSVEPSALTLAPGKRLPSRDLGLMLFYPDLQVVDLLELAAQIYQLAGMVRCGVQQVFTEWFCLALPRLLANRHCERCSPFGAANPLFRAAHIGPRSPEF